MPILTPDELVRLLRVPTTVEQAQQIRERNCELLRLVQEGRSGQVDIGCPHCNRWFDCSDCGWQKYFDFNPFRMPCCRATFGGASLGLTHRFRPTEAGVEYTHNMAWYTHADDMSEELKADIVAFLRGHIEWADEVIQRGGTAVPDAGEETGA